MALHSLKHSQWILFFLFRFAELKEIAFVMRNKVFKDMEQEDIDLFDIKVC